MKQTTIAAFLTFVLLACNKSDQTLETKKEPYYIRVAAPNGLTVDYSPIAIVKAVNGGQDGENNYGKLEYAGYSGGHYILNLTNKQSCGVDFTVSWLGYDTTIYINGSATKTIQLPGTPVGNTKIKAKPLYKCGSSGGDMGQLEVVTPVSLPVTFKYIRAESVGSNQVKVSFEVAEASGVDVYYIQLSKDGKNYSNAFKVQSDKVSVNKLYSVIVNL